MKIKLIFCILTLGQFLFASETNQTLEIYIKATYKLIQEQQELTKQIKTISSSIQDMQKQILNLHLSISDINKTTQENKTINDLVEHNISAHNEVLNYLNTENINNATNNQNSNEISLQTKKEAKIRETPQNGSKLIKTIPANSIVNAIGIDENGYYKIVDGGFLHKSYVKKIENNTTALSINIEKSVNR